MDIPTLSANELNNIKSEFYNFVIRVSSDTNDKWPDEVKILPAITEILLRFTD